MRMSANYNRSYLRISVAAALFAWLGLFAVSPLAAVDKPKIGIYFFQHLHLVEGKAPVGSGIEYGEEVLAGFLASGLFTADQLLLTTSLDDDQVQYVVGADWIGFSKDGASCFIKSPMREAPLMTLVLPLPKEWDKAKPGYSLGRGRMEIMRKLGRRLAEELAGIIRDGK